VETDGGGRAASAQVRPRAQPWKKIVVQSLVFISINFRVQLSMTMPVLVDDPPMAMKTNEAKMIKLDLVTKSSEQLRHEESMKGLITVEGAVEDVGLVSGVPEEHIKVMTKRINSFSMVMMLFEIHF
jgi:hypothetical protein